MVHLGCKNMEDDIDHEFKSTNSLKMLIEEQLFWEWGKNAIWQGNLKSRATYICKYWSILFVNIQEAGFSKNTSKHWGNTWLRLYDDRVSFKLSLSLVRKKTLMIRIFCTSNYNSWLAKILSKSLEVEEASQNCITLVRLSLKTNSHYSPIGMAKVKS